MKRAGAEEVLRLGWSQPKGTAWIGSTCVEARDVMAAREAVTTGREYTGSP
jgi:hypothetical protein